jgi:sugar/nucleoside kinase (ribokinase family)
MSLLVTGSIGIDTVETPAGRRDNVIGGSAVYFSYAASFFAPVRLVGVVGEDAPKELFKVFEGRDVDAGGLEVRKGSKTFRWHGSYVKDLNEAESIQTDLNVLAERAPKIPDNFRDSRYVFLANTHPAVQMQMLESLPQRTLAVADTMDLWINVARDELGSLLRRVDGLVLNYDEAELLTGKRNTVAASRAILAMGPSFVVVKKGEHGCILVHKDGIAALPAYPTETVVDPTGAGDSFAGGLMGHLAAAHKHGPLAFETLRRGLAHGTVIASFTIEDFSLERLAALTRAQLADRYDRYLGMVRV